jgi:hypothetical protein
MHLEPGYDGTMSIPSIYFERSKLAKSLVDETWQRRRDASPAFDAVGLIDECFSLGYVARRMWSDVKDVFFSDAQDVETLGDNAKQALDEHVRVVEKTIELTRSIADGGSPTDQLGRLEEELAAIRGIRAEADELWPGEDEELDRQSMLDHERGDSMTIDEYIGAVAR